MGIGQRLRREWAEFVGPEATVTANVGTLGLACAGTGLALWLARRQLAGKPLVQLLLGGLALDLWGGVWANNTLACARWYERAGQTDRQHYQFALIHLHPFAIAWLDGTTTDRPPRWWWAASHYLCLQCATVVIRQQWQRRRALGPGLTLLGILLDLGIGPTRIAPWFAPVFYCKLLHGHMAAACWSDEQLHALPEPQVQP